MIRSSVAPSTSVARPARIRVLVDEAHSQAWSVRPAVSAAMQPAHPADSSYAMAAQLLADREVEVLVHEEGLLDASALDGIHVVITAHPSDPAWESTTGVGSPIYRPEELEALHRFVADGGGLVVLGETEEAKYGANLDELLAPYGIGFRNVTVQDYEHHHSAPSWVMADLAATGSTAAGVTRSPLLHRVDAACFYRAGALTVDPARATGVMRAHLTATPGDATLAATAEHGRGRVVVFADSDLFGDDCIEQFDHAQLWVNAFYWAALPSFASAAQPILSSLASDPAWPVLRESTEQLRMLQSRDGSIDLSLHDRVQVSDVVERIIEAITALSRHVPWDADVLAQVIVDLRDWVAGGCGKPDFLRSLELLRPERERVDGREHLIVLPLYTPNGSGDTRFEALIIRGPWPSWLATMERTRFHNAKFVPVTLVDYTSGYASECAVFFPETVSVIGSAPNHFGGIFCDREAQRFGEVTGAAVAAVRLALPPDAAALLADASLATDAFLLWDLIHDRTHSRGDLPFDPFMVRQRMPYWMYSLEELRCDLTSFVEAGELVEEFPFARHVQYAVLLDRMLRFPVTGTRVRNYDGLGGQILFGALHSAGVARWTDNTLVLDWAALPGAVTALLEEVRALYRLGIDSSRVRYWAAAHDLVARYVPPALASAWTPQVRMVDAPAEDDAKAWVDRVLDDEFPINLFFRSLQASVEPVLRERAATFAARQPISV